MARHWECTDQAAAAHKRTPAGLSTRRPASIHLSGLSRGWMATEYQRVSETAREMGDGACCQMGLIMLLICVCLFVRVSRRRTSDRNTIHSCGWITLIAIQASFCGFLSRARIWVISGYINIRFPFFACLVVLLIFPKLNFTFFFFKWGQSLFG